MELSGNLKKFDVSKIFQLISTESATGVLALRRKRTRITIAVRDGLVVDVEESERPKDQRMGQTLTASGRLGEGELTKLLEERRSRLVRLGTVLREKGLLSDREEADLALLVYNDILFEALSWRDGLYDIKQQEVVDPGELAAPISMVTVLLNAAQQEDEWPRIRRYVPSMEIVFAPAPAAVETGKWESLLNTLGPEDRKAAERIDGASSVRMIAASLLRPEFEVTRLIAEISSKGLLVRVSRPRTAGEGLKRLDFFALEVGPAAVVPLAVIFSALLLLFAWQHYLQPLVAEPQRLTVPIADAGRRPQAIDRLRFQSVVQAVRLYRIENGAPPPSLQTLARQGYCAPGDLRTTDGGGFELKVLGRAGQTALVRATDAEGRARPELTVEFSLR